MEFIDPSRINRAPVVAGHAGRESLREHIDLYKLNAKRLWISTSMTSDGDNKRYAISVGVPVDVQHITT
jgi:hypothetical protein